MKFVSVVSVLSILLSLFFIPLDVVAIESENILRISKTGGMWNDYVNMMNIIFPGGTISGLYYHKLYAEYDGNIGGFVVVDKVASHCSYSRKVEEAAFGLCFSYNPEYSEGRSFGKENYKVWEKIRVGDVLYPHGIDFTDKSIKAEGNLLDGTLSTKSYFTVSYSERNLEPTAYTGKKVVALGDSVTCNGGWTETVGDLMGCEIINSGVSANRATEALVRFDSDVKAYTPDIVFIMLGINDCVQYYYSEKTVLTFKNELIELYNKCNQIGAKVVFITPNNIKVESLDFERYKNYGGISNCFPKFIEIIKNVAKETNSHCIDLYSHFFQTEKLLCDSVHPNKEGYDIISSVVAEYMISFADVICGEDIEGYVSSGIGEFEISHDSIYLSECTVEELKEYFCNDICVYCGDETVSLNESIKNGYKICWIDKNGVGRDYINIFLND